MIAGQVQKAVRLLQGQWPLDLTCTLFAYLITKESEEKGPITWYAFLNGH